MRKMPRAARTKMKSFGSSMRMAHDSSDFYSRRMYASADRTEVNEIRENSVQGDVVDRVFCRSSKHMAELPDDCVHLMVTSPPYNVGKDYDQDLSLVEYRRLLNDVFREVYRVLVVGGRAC
ncbi:MAG: site-specific DNA-methyltransferase, partial [Nitrososphaerota archaeon]|nr:site-specific DNA-methyltransferase [Nitrososphaerota archaeon]